MKDRLPTRHVCCKSNVCHRYPSHAALSRGKVINRQYFFRVFYKLQSLLPPAHRVVVHTGRCLAKAQGTCQRLDRKFCIRVSKHLPDSVATDVLLHEWAHAMSWDAALDKAAKSRKVSDAEFEHMSHGRKWGLAYSRVYRVFIKEIVPQLLAEDLNPPFFRQAIKRGYERSGRTPRRRSGTR